nr:MAG TPA: hypothetical protein [Caudoviricetes sp.]
MIHYITKNSTSYHYFYNYLASIIIVISVFCTMTYDKMEGNS